MGNNGAYISQNVSLETDLEMNLPADCLYTPTDEWLRREGDTLTLGLTDYGQNELGELVFVELPPVGTMVRAGMPFGVVESVKAVAELVSPLAGAIVAVNEAVAGEPTLVNESPYQSGWLVRLKVGDETALSGLLDAAAYARLRS